VDMGVEKSIYFLRWVFFRNSWGLVVSQASLIGSVVSTIAVKLIFGAGQLIKWAIMHSMKPSCSGIDYESSVATEQLLHNLLPDLWNTELCVKQWATIILWLKIECRELVWNLVSCSNQVKVDNSGLPIVWEECFGGERTGICGIFV